MDKDQKAAFKLVEKQRKEENNSNKSSSECHCDEHHEENEQHQLTTDLKHVAENVWLLGNSGFGISYKTEEEAYYLVDGHDEKAVEEGEAVHVWTFPSKLDQQTELRCIQFWCNVFIYGMSYAHSKRDLMGVRLHVAAEFTKQFDTTKEAVNGG